MTRLAQLDTVAPLFETNQTQMKTYSFNPNLLFLNIGLKVGDSVPPNQKDNTLTMLEITALLCKMSLEVASVVDSDTEPTVVAVLSGFDGARAAHDLPQDDDRTRFDEVLASLAAALNQEAIASLEVEWGYENPTSSDVLAKVGPGALFGPKAADWGYFDPKRFIMRPSGETLDHALENTATNPSGTRVTMVRAEGVKS